jgi:hypothetical protein
MRTHEIIYWLNKLEDRGLLRAVLIIITFFAAIFGFSMLALWLLFRPH